MFGVLLESKARRQRRNGGAVLSVVMHVGILSLAATLTARGSSVRAPSEPVALERIRLAPVAPTRSLHRRRPSGTAAKPCCPDIEIHVLRGLMSGPHVAEPGKIELPPLTEPEVQWPGEGGSGGARQFAGGILDGDDSTREWNASDVAVRLVTPARPRYPEMLREAGIVGHVLAEFEVDTTGRVDMSSVRILESTHDLFARAVRDALPAMRLIPASVRGRKVRMLAQLPFEFTVERR